MPGKKQRVHYKVQQLPEEIVSEVHARIVEGHTYAAIAAHIRAMGHAIATSSVARYGQQYLERYRRLRESAEIARTIVAENGNVDLEEAASRLGVELILHRLLDTPELGGELDVCRALDSLTRAQSSAVTREKWKQELAKRVAAAAQACERTARQGGLSDAAVQEIRARSLGVAA
jgi:hypothetical protein